MTSVSLNEQFATLMTHSQSLHLPHVVTLSHVSPQNQNYKESGGVVTLTGSAAFAVVSGCCGQEQTVLTTLSCVFILTLLGEKPWTLALPVAVMNS